MAPISQWLKLEWGGLRLSPLQDPSGCHAGVGGLPCLPSRPPAFSVQVHPTTSGLNFYLNDGLPPFVRVTPSSPKAAALTCPAPMWTKSRAGKPSSSNFLWDFDFACSRYWVSGAPSGVLAGPPSPCTPGRPGHLRPCSGSAAGLCAQNIPHGDGEAGFFLISFQVPCLI